MKRTINLIFACLITFSVTACQKNYYDPASVNVSLDTPPAPQIILDQKEVNIEAGDTVQLTATVKNEPKEKIKILWTTADEKIATVSTEGKVIAKNAGEVSITAHNEDNTLSASCTVTVNALRKANIKGNVPTESRAGYTYTVNVKFENCANPSVKIIANCGGGTIKNADGTTAFGNGEEQLKATGDASISFRTTGTKKINSLRVLCFDNDELIDSKEYNINLIK